MALMTNLSNPLIIQSDKTVLLEVENPCYEECRDQLARFAELVKSPEHVHTYRITPLSLWNAAAAGMTAEQIIGALGRFSKYDLPGNVRVDVADYVTRYGKVKLLKRDGDLLLVSSDALLLTEISRNKRIAPLLRGQLDANTLLVDPLARGHVKHALVDFGFPAEDLAGYVEGTPLPVALRAVTRDGVPFGLRRYQRESVDAFYAGGDSRGGSGVVVLPCGAGKTIVGLGALAKVAAQTLILTTSTIAVRQWVDELVNRTTLLPDEIGEYTGESKEIKPVTIATYQVLTWRPFKVDKETGEIGEFPHLRLFSEQNWGLIIYDEVHLLPAPVFRITADIQARRRLGLTATLVREDGRETDVFSLIGPKKYDVPWRDLEKQGWIATAECHEIRVTMDPQQRMDYVVADDKNKYRLAAENPAKMPVLRQLVEKHRGDQVLVIGQYLDQLHAIAAELKAPLITGKTATVERERLYGEFREGKLPLLVVSKVANFAIDLPDANVAIQVSGTFGSRQEEAQRLGRILRPKPNGVLANFYSIVTRDTRDQDFAQKRQLFLTEQGYRYIIMDAHEVPAYIPVSIDTTGRLCQPAALPPGPPAA